MLLSCDHLKCWSRLVIVCNVTSIHAFFRQASFFIAYVVTSGWTSTSSELFRIIPFIWSLLKRPFVRDTDEEFEVPSIPYHRDIPRILFFGLLGITYFFLAPLILPFLLIYLCLAYIIFRNQVSGHLLLLSHHWVVASTFGLFQLSTRLIWNI